MLHDLPMSDQNLESLFSEVAEKIKREAYVAGWRDAIAAINKSVGELVDPATLEAIEIRDAKAAPTVLHRDANSKLPKQGSTPWEVIQAVKKHPGMSTVQLIDAIHAGGHGAPEGSIRTSIFRVKNRKFIVARHNKWYPA
jgi:hypothetical protein